MSSDRSSIDIIAACHDIDGLRTWVSENQGIMSTELGNFWLPIVWTARGPLYAEAISRRQDGSYHQPFHLRDRVRQPLYQLGFNLLSNLDASPAVYLLQFDLIESLTKSSSDHAEIRFDRLLPSPDEPAKASIGVQEPNLFDCHWLCITRSPIYDLVIRG